MDVPEKFHEQLVTFVLLINEKITKQILGIHKDRLTASQFLVVATVKNYGSITMSALAERMDIQKQQATKIVNQLVEMGLMHRIPYQKDRRIIHVDLTETGNEFMYNYFIESMKNISRHFSALDEREFAELRAAIEAFNKILPHVS
jgi:DNA-binding MarR family transcriptional regulator